jgi:alpha-tubulin suppressor-like RCC1 family protein
VNTEGQSSHNDAEQAQPFRDLGQPRRAQQRVARCGSTSNADRQRHQRQHQRATLRGFRMVVAVAGLLGGAVAVGSSGSVPTVSAAPVDDVRFVSLQPARLLDTRPGSATVDGGFAGAGAVGAGRTLEVTVVGRGGVPATGVGAVVLNITVTEPTAAGFVTVFPTGAAQPTASNLNFVAGQTTPNLTIAKVGDSGRVSLFNSAGSTHLIADVVGWFPTVSTFTSLQPARLLDTRPGLTTVDGQFAGVGAVGPGGTLDVTVVGRGGVPATGVGAVVLNITATDPTAAGFVTVFPTGTTRPTASNLNFVAGETTPNLTIAKVGDGGNVSLFNFAGSTDLIADVVGWFPSASSFASLQPARLLDTRPGLTTVDGQFAGIGAVGPGGTLDVTVVGRGGVPATGVGAVVLNITATEPTAPGFVTVFPTGATRPTASNLNFVAGQTTPNLTIAKVGVGGKVSLFNLAGNTHVIVDVVGWFPSVAAIAVSAGQFHTCALLANATVRCWGTNGRGELGNGTLLANGYAPSTVSGITNATAISVGFNYSCALLADGTIKCWGENGEGELGNGTVTDAATPVTVSGITTATAVAAGQFHTCALLADRTVKCWGTNVSGQLGNGGTPTNFLTPVTVTAINTATAISAGAQHSCALLADATIKCWGDNSTAQLGIGNQLRVTGPVTVTGITTAVAVQAGTFNSCALLADATEQCWGANPQGQLGNGTLTPSLTAAPVTGINNAVAIGSIRFFSCAALADDTVKCWGENESGELGNGTIFTTALAPITVVGITNATSVTVGSAHACALLADGSIDCWGYNGTAQLGNPVFNFSTVPVPVLGL